MTRFLAYALYIVSMLASNLALLDADLAAVSNRTVSSTASAPVDQ